MTNPIDKAGQPDALFLADLLSRIRIGDSWRSIGGTIAKSAAELRRLHAELATQAAQIEACRAEAARPDQAEDALLKVLAVVQRYLPPDGPTAHDAMSDITAIVDPWPVTAPKEKA